ncbi:MMPL family transporter [Longispora albida]|uniref:MMPL family transporter n=1 Tax=Longispora albida TaxID=203523 RepID=UPI000372AEA8|nr:MMPL family transporter [Longispora albida]
MAHPLLDDPPAAAAPAPHRPGFLGRLAGWSFRRRGTTIAAWIVALGLAFGLSSMAGGDYSADYSAPGSDSTAAQDLLKREFPAASGTTISVVFQAPGGLAAAQGDVEALLAKMDDVPHVRSTESPFAVPGSIAPGGTTGLAKLRLDESNPADMPKEDTKKLLDLAKAAPAGLKVSLSGQAVEFAEQGAIGSEGIGMAAAAIILLITFGSIVAAGLPLLTAIAGLGVSSLLIPVLAALMPVPDWSTSLAAMMGIGVGIDYVLLLVTRYREWRAEGLDPEAATVATLDTAGRSVLVAGLTVVTSMLGLFAMGLSFMRGAAFAAILSVLVVLVASATLFPALLGYLGRHVDKLRLPGMRKQRRAANEISPGWLRWSKLIERHRVAAALLGAVALLALAAPFLGVRFGFPDEGNNATDRSTRQAYDAIAQSFGPGANGPLLVVAELPNGDQSGLPALSKAIGDIPGVKATPPQVSPSGKTAMLTVFPPSGPQAKATEDLVHDLRDKVIPSAGVGGKVHVGGFTAVAIDSTENIVKRLPLLVGGVVAVSMLLLLVSFRSIAVAVKAAAMNLLSVAAAYGVVALVLEGGWAGELIGIHEPTPLPAFVPVLTFAVLFGLSMDYEVFLVSRMREAWLATRDNGQSIVSGLATTGRVITAAAAIMVAVFAAFVPAPEIPIKVIGVGMASAILIDATLVRMVLVPAVMHLMGRGNWWLPAWLDRRMPQLHLEGNPEKYTPARG